MPLCNLWLELLHKHNSDVGALEAVIEMQNYCQHNQSSGAGSHRLRRAIAIGQRISVDINKDQQIPCWALSPSRHPDTNRSRRQLERMLQLHNNARERSRNKKWSLLHESRGEHARVLRVILSAHSDSETSATC